MKTVDIHELFEHAALELGMYKLNALLCQKNPDNPVKLRAEELMHLAGFINHCKTKRGAEMVNFVTETLNDELSLSWNEWNSGGGCMIWSYDFLHSDGKTYSVHTDGESVCLSNNSSAEYWALESWEEQEKCLLVNEIISEESKLAFLICPYAGQELADKLERDLWLIYND